MVPRTPHQRFIMFLSVLGSVLVLVVVGAVVFFIPQNSLRGFVLYHDVQLPGGSEVVFYGRHSPGEQAPVPAHAHAIFECPTDALPSGYEWMNPRDFNDGYGPKNSVPGLTVYEYADALYTTEKNASLTGSIRWPGRTYGFSGKPDTLTTFASGKVYHVHADHGFEFACARHCTTVCTPSPNCQYNNIVYNQLGCVDQCGTPTCSASSSSISSVQSSSTSSDIAFLCGNGVIDSGVSGPLEECDDGNIVDGDGCFDNCATMMRPYKFTGTSSSSSSYDAGPRLYVLDTGNKTIQSIRPDITAANPAKIVLVYGNADRVGLAVDPTERKMYWLSNTSHTVQRSNLDGTQKEAFASFSGSTALGSSITVDVTNRYVYWSEYTPSPLITRIIRKQITTGSPLKLTARITGDIVGSVVVESNTGANPNVYFSLLNQKKIMKLAYPNVITTVVTFSSNAANVPFALDASSTPKKLYWIDTGINAVRRATIDGTAQETLALSWTPASMLGLALDATHKNVFIGSRGGLLKTGFTGGLVYQHTAGIENPAFLQYFNGP